MDTKPAKPEAVVRGSLLPPRVAMPSRVHLQGSPVWLERRGHRFQPNFSLRGSSSEAPHVGFAVNVL